MPKPKKAKPAKRAARPLPTRALVQAAKRCYLAPGLYLALRRPGKSPSRLTHPEICEALGIAYSPTSERQLRKCVRILVELGLLESEPGSGRTPAKYRTRTPA